MIKVMEPRAANKFLKADNDTKTNNVVYFQETGKVPSMRTLDKLIKEDRLPRTKSDNVAKFNSADSDRIAKKLSSVNLKASDILKWMIALSEAKTPSPETIALIETLYQTTHQQTR